MLKELSKSKKNRLLNTAAAFAMLGLSGVVVPELSIPSAFAAEDDCGQDNACAQQLEMLLAGEEAAELQNRKVEAQTGQDTGIDGFKISVDGSQVARGVSQPVGGSDKTAAKGPAIASADSLNNVDLDVRFDGLDVARQLAVSTVGERRTVAPGEKVEFYGNWNYPAWIKRAEVRIYRRKDMPAEERLRSDARPIDVIELNGQPNSGSGRGNWNAPQDSDIGNGTIGSDDHDLVYTVRVYDDQNRFDESRPLSLKLTSDADLLASSPNRDQGPNSVPGQDVDNVAVKNIPVHGGAVTIHGRNIPEGYTVSVMGTPVPLGHDETNSGRGYSNKLGDEYHSRGNDAFVISRILPPGEHDIEVEVAAADPNAVKSGRSLVFDQEVNIPENEFFYVGLADVTWHRKTGDDSKSLYNYERGDYDKDDKKGRLAFYMKGKMQGKYILTAAFDTKEKDLDKLFENLDEKDPRQLLRRLDPDDYYPIYGDDSTVVQDAPTAGKFYVKLERGESHVMWGNFKTSIDGTELTRFERGLYGAHGVLKSDQSTSFGEPVAKLEGFAAQPDTLAQRDEFRGTGGSAYFMRHQDINQGSEQLYIEERDRVTGLVVERRELVEGRDYSFDYTQGIVLLNSPLHSTTGASTVVHDTATGGNQQYLVAQYEYTPGLDSVDGSTYGGRGEAWLGDHLKVGVTGYREDTGVADQTLYGADATLRLAEKSYVEFEWARSKGDTFDYLDSTDGGFIFDRFSGDGLANDEASEAWRTKVAIDLQELTGYEDDNGKLQGGIKGTIGGQYEHRDAGFNAPGRYTEVGERIWGVFGEVEASDAVKISGRYDDVKKRDDRQKREANAEVGVKFDERWSATVGVQHSDITDPYAYDSKDTGSRTDLGLRVTNTISDSFKVWAFGQVTLDTNDGRERNDRGGVGIEADITDQITASAEVSYGTTGLGALASLSYEPTVDERYYLGYRIAPEDLGGSTNSEVDYDPFGRDYGSIVLGANRKLGDRTSAYMEQNFDLMGRQRSHTHTYGVTFNPDDVWKITGGIESGRIYDEVDGDFDRNAFSVGVNYKEPGRDFGARFEARFEDGKDGFDDRDRNTYLGRANLGIDYNDNWRFLAKIDAVISDSNEEDYLNGDYVEGSVGWAYRPVENDDLNALFKYTYLYDLPGYNQVNAHDEKYSYAQRSHVLSADFIYDLNDYWSIGGKYAYRLGEVSRDRSADDFRDDSAHLGVIRADYHLVKNWDVFAEGRILDMPDLDQRHYGVLAGVYRHFGDNFKVGVGYNFGKFSDDITDLSLDDEGFFVNVVGKF